jgi:hypothetical protein
MEGRQDEALSSGIPVCWRLIICNDLKQRFAPLPGQLWKKHSCFVKNVALFFETSWVLMEAVGSVDAAPEERR